MSRSDVRPAAEHKSIHWDATSGPDGASKQIQRWQHTFSGSHLPWSVAIDRDSGSAGFHRCAFQKIDDLVLVDCVCDPCRGARESDQLNETDGEFAVVVFMCTGSETLRQRQEDLELRPGDVFLWDSTLPAAFQIHKRLRKRSLIVPRTVLDVVGRRRVAGAVRLDSGSPVTLLLNSYVASLSRTGPVLDRGAAISARNAAVELLLAALRATGTPVAGVTRDVLRDQMMRYIDSHLGPDDITPAALAVAHSVSERTVHRIFKESGETVGDVVRRRRLARARQQVIDSGLSLSTIAHRWGYADLSHFTRSFRAMYGYPPSHLRR
jgi:AraC family transcriptional regulator, positive regulator of tynA and feaB